MANTAEARTARLDNARRRLLTHIQDNVDEAFIKRVTIPGFVPSEEKIRYALAYVSATPNAKQADILKVAEVSTSSLRRWRARPIFNKWMHAVCTACTGTCVDLVWRIFGELAADGNVQAGKMILERFDLDWRAIQAHTALPSHGAGPSDAELEATRAQLRSATDEPLDEVAYVKGTCASGEEPGPTQESSPSKPEGGGGGSEAGIQ